MLKVGKNDLFYYILITYIYVLIFSGWILKISGIPTELSLLIVKGIDYFPICFWVLSNPSFVLSDKVNTFISLKFWIVCFLILILLLITSWVHGEQSILFSIQQWGALIRYIPLACIVYEFQKEGNYWDKFVVHLRYFLTILLFLFFIVWIGGNNVMMFFLPVMSENATGVRESLEGHYSVIFANTIDFAFLLVLLYTVFINNARWSKYRRFLFSILIFIPIVKTGSVISAFVFCLIAGLAFTYRKPMVRVLLGCLLLILVFYLSYKFWYEIQLVVENAKLSRLGMLTLTLPDFLSEMSLDTLFGVGCDGYVVLDKVNSYKEQVHMLLYALPGDLSAFGDVYWVALLVFHGLIGFSLIFYLFYSVYHSAVGKYSDNFFLYRNIVTYLFLSIIIFAFFNQVLVVKTFSSFFWILMGFILSKNTQSVLGNKI